MAIGAKFYQLGEVDSTNEYAKRIMNEAPEGTVVIADVQTAGKGRMGRRWFSPEGGIWMSVVLDGCDGGLIPLAAGVAICEAFQPYGIDLGIKWPNDVLLKGKKIAGVLVDVIEERTIMGIGINLNVREFPDELKEKASSILIETNKHLDAQDLYHDLCRAIEDNYQLVKEQRIDELLGKWQCHSVMTGRHVRIEQPDRIVIGRVLDIDRQGALVIMQYDNTVEHIIAGDCALLK